MNGIVSPAKTLLDWWMPRIEDLFGQRLNSIVLFGSLTFDDYCPGWSDVDTCIVLPTPITQEEAAALADVYDRMKAAFPDQGSPTQDYGQLVEGMCIPSKMVSDPELALPCYCAGSQGIEPGFRLSPFDRHMLAEHGVGYCGEEQRFAGTTRQELAQDTLGQVADLRHPKALDRSPIWHAGMLHWVARSIVYWRDDRLISKTAALEQEIQSKSPFSDNFRLALTVRREGSAAAESYRDRLQSAFGSVAVAAADCIETLVSTANCRQRHLADS